MADSFLDPFSKLSNGRAHYAHRHVAHYAGNGCAFLCADAGVRFIDAPRRERHLRADSDENEIAVSYHTDGAVNSPGMRSLTPEATNYNGGRTGLPSDYDGNYAGKIVPARRPWLTQSNMTEARNRRLPFAGSRLQLAEQRDSCIAQIGDGGRHFGQMRASNRCELCRERRRNILCQKNEGQHGEDHSIWIDCSTADLPNAGVGAARAHADG